jgi:hypothetical protein
MDNPWKSIDLEDYENHMKLDTVLQLQALNQIMRDQLNRYPVASVIIFGVAGGNGLNHIDESRFHVVYGLDINAFYLEECKSRYPQLEGVLCLIEADLLNETVQLPKGDLVIANLLIEYIGYDCFQRAIQKCSPQYVSCVIQINFDNSRFVSDSPYLHVFDGLENVHHQVEEKKLTEALEESGYQFTFKEEILLPNNKKLIRLDYERGEGVRYERI